jgi:hypothetical protein
LALRDQAQSRSLGLCCLSSFAPFLLFGILAALKFIIDRLANEDRQPTITYQSLNPLNRLER